MEQVLTEKCPSWERMDGAQRVSVLSSAAIWRFSADSLSRRLKLAAGRERARTAAPAGITTVLNTPREKRCATAIPTVRKPGTAARTISVCAKYLPLTVWWGLGVPGHHVHLHAGLVAQRGVAKYLFPLETEARPVLISNSVEVALVTTLFAVQRKRWQRSCPILSRGISRTLGGDHTC